MPAAAWWAVCLIVAALFRAPLVMVLLTTLVTGRLGAINWGVLEAGVVITMVPCIVISPAAAALLRARAGGRRGQVKLA
jgi:hypothetical protein